jgi:hypothetical protein
LRRRGNLRSGRSRRSAGEHGDGVPQGGAERLETIQVDSPGCTRVYGNVSRRGNRRPARPRFDEGQVPARCAG